jgi:hypothetical protein
MTVMLILGLKLSVKQQAITKYQPFLPIAANSSGLTYGWLYLIPIFHDLS